MKRTFYLFFPDFKNVDFKKDMGMIPRMLGRHFPDFYDVTILLYGNRNDFSRIDEVKKEVQIDFVKENFGRKFRNIY